MEVPVEQELVAALLQQPAVIGMRRQWPLAVPVRDHSYGETTPEQRREVLEHHARLARIRRRAVMNTDKKEGQAQPSTLNASVGLIRSARLSGMAHAASPASSMMKSAARSSMTWRIDSRPIS